MPGDLRTAVHVGIEGSGRFRAETRRMGRSLDALGGSTRTAARANRAYQQATARAAAATRTSTQSILTAHGAIARYAAAFGAYRIVRTITSFERLRAQMRAVAGDAGVAATEFSRLQRFAAQTPFSLQELVQGYIQLSAVSVDASDDVLRSLGNLAAVFGNFGDLVTAVLSRERETFKRFGVDLRQNGDAITVAYRDFTTTVENSSPGLVRALKEIADRFFPDGMAQRARTLEGALNNLGDASDALADAFGRGGFSAALSDVARDLSTLGSTARGLAFGLGGLAGHFLSLAASVAPYAAALGAARVAAVGLTAAYAPLNAASRAASALRAAEVRDALAAANARRAETTATLAALAAQRNYQLTLLRRASRDPLASRVFSARKLESATRGLAAARTADAAAARVQATAQAAANAQLTAAGRLTRGLRGALALLGGPIGAITTALSLGATAWVLWGGAAKAAAKEADDALDAQIEALRRAGQTPADHISGLIEQQRERLERLREERNRLVREEIDPALSQPHIVGLARAAGTSGADFVRQNLAMSSGLGALIREWDELNERIRAATEALTYLEQKHDEVRAQGASGSSGAAGGGLSSDLDAFLSIRSAAEDRLAQLTLDRIALVDRAERQAIYDAQARAIDAGASEQQIAETITAIQRVHIEANQFRSRAKTKVCSSVARAHNSLPTAGRSMPGIRASIAAGGRVDAASAIGLSSSQLAGPSARADSTRARTYPRPPSGGVVVVSTPSVRTRQRTLRPSSTPGAGTGPSTVSTVPPRATPSSSFTGPNRRATKGFAGAV